MLNSKRKLYLLFAVYTALLICPVLLASFKSPLNKNKLVGGLFERMEFGGLCTRNLYFINDSIYSFEGGCEASSRYHFGTWKQKRDTFTFTCDTAIFLNPVIRIKARKVKGDSINVQVRNEKGVVFQYFQVAVRMKNGGVRLLKYNEKDSIHVGPSLSVSESLRLYSLEKGYKRPFILSTDKGNFIDVTVRIPPNLNGSGNSILNYVAPFKLVLRGDSLVSIEAQLEPSAFNRIIP